ncbi:MAG: DM13 domain-containing protein [Actinomycetota bacterium]
MSNTESPSGLSRIPRWMYGAGVAGLVVLGYLAFGVFGIHTAFIDDEVNEDVPVFASGAGASGLPSDAMTDEEAAEMNDFMADAGTPVEVEADEGAPMDAPEIVVEAAGTFIDRSHPAEGIAEVLGDGTGQRFLRFEDFATDNGPDLNVYLSTAAPDAPAGEFDDDFVDLGDLKGNIGPQNYEIPADVDLDRYTTVVIWCVRFGVAFGAAELMAG